MAIGGWISRSSFHAYIHTLSSMTVYFTHLYLILLVNLTPPAGARLCSAACPFELHSREITWLPT